MQKVVFITGISTGFGKATAKLLAERGHKVYGGLRNLSEINPSFNVLRIDLTKPESIKSAVDTIVRNEGRIDVLINNAGMHSGGAIETVPDEIARLQMETNFNGMIHLLREVLPVMRNQKSGKIINISSIGGLMGLPFQGFYSASKFAIEGLSSALRMEVRKYNIKVVVINPGDFKTSNSKNRRNFITPPENDPYSVQFNKSLAIIEKDEASGWPAEILARKLVDIVELKNPAYRYIVASLEQKLAVFLHWLLPGKLFYRILSSHYGID